jgi:hypothetical protein
MTKKPKMFLQVHLNEHQFMPSLECHCCSKRITPGTMAYQDMGSHPFKVYYCEACKKTWEENHETE